MLGAFVTPLKERFDAQTCPEPNSGCLLWTGSPDRVGYGQIRVRETGRKEMAHRVAFFLHYGRWPMDKLLHQCDTRACVNVAHVREGSQAENVRETVERGRHRQAARTFCKNGHALTPDNLYQYPGKYGPLRHCRACVLNRGRRYKAARWVVQ